MRIQNRMAKKALVGKRGRAQGDKTENNTWKERGSWERRLEKEDDQREEGNGSTENFLNRLMAFSALQSLEFLTCLSSEF